ncbi:hypothetical protein E3N88_33749 [Mikania micrantha]|uniref:Uncharacterized protein n=1 Tax=Mikania micrantha TaxID=192012 RepID=A0A5N6MEQ3_9ASTR|nr:hypothetical protein E3N88_33749 [Mikania micrantha]
MFTSLKTMIVIGKYAKTRRNNENGPIGLVRRPRRYARTQTSNLGGARETGEVPRIPAFRASLEAIVEIFGGLEEDLKLKPPPLPSCFCKTS